MTKAYLMNGLIEKMQSPDQDFRYMGLNDLMTEVKADAHNFSGDENTEMKVLKQVLALVQDKISEVKNQAVKCLGQLIKVINDNQMNYVVDELISFLGSKEDEIRDIAGLALKTITSELPVDGKTTTKTCEKLVPRLLKQLTTPTTPETLIETLMTLSILITRFPALISSMQLEPQPLAVLSPLLSHQRPAVRKRAITTLAQFVPISQPGLFANLLNGEVLPTIASGNTEKQQTMIQLLAAVSRVSPGQVAPSLSEIVPGVLKAIQKENEELRESGLQTLEALVLRCPAEVVPFLPQIIQTGTTYIKYDPNYAGDDDDEDEEMADADDEDDAELDEYEDEEDQSYKIRRASTKLLGAVLATRPELLPTLYRDVSPVLIQRFGDREETVRLEIWSTYGIFLSQTRVYGGALQFNGTKRKRDSEGMEVEETAQALLKAQVPSLSKALLAQMKSPKANPSTLQAGYELLSSLLQVLPGALSQQTALITSISKNVLSQPPTTATSSLHLTCLPFLRAFFATHTPSSYSSSVPTLTPVLVKSLREKHPRISSEAFRVFSALLAGAKPVKADDWADAVYDETLARLSKSDTDAEVRAAAEEVAGDLWVHAPDVVRAKEGKEWDAICRTTGRVDGAVKVVTRVAREGDVSEQWLNSMVEWIVTLLRKGGKSGKVEAFVCLEAIIARYPVVPPDLSANLIPQIKPFVTLQDTSLLSQALAVPAALLRRSPAATFPIVERDLLSDIYPLAISSLVTGPALDGILGFFAALVEADPDIATRIIPSLTAAFDLAPKGQTSPGNVARCLAQVVKSHNGVAAATIAQFAKHVKADSKSKPATIVLSLFVLGELGRFIDMSNQTDVFKQSINRFTADEEEVRIAAAFAAGNIAIGNSHQFLPPIIKLVQTDATRRLSALHAVKEIVTKSSHGQLEVVADSLWTPLFDDSESSEETTRNVAAACLGKLTTTHASRYLPQLHARIRDADPKNRATVVSAIRYTFSDSDTSYDELLAPLIVDFLSLIVDSDLTVRRLALSALNSAARTKPHLIRDHLASILPSLYQETVVKPELIRTVQMGPWTQKFDDGLEARKTAYETMYTLLDTCLSKLDLHEFINRVVQGLSDDSDEVKVISHMMLFRLAQLAPTAVAQRLDEITPVLEQAVKGAAVTKDTVKQDLERAAELKRSASRAIAALAQIKSEGTAPKWEKFVEELNRDPAFKEAMKEVRV